jgi:class 3 adenylate cyclase
MEREDNELRKEENRSQSIDLEKLLEERERLDDLIKKKFTRDITIMFTDIKGSTSIAEKEGDVVSRMMIKKCNDILLPVIEKNSGILVKTMGDGTLSYFDNASDAVRAAVKIQSSIDYYNLTKKSSTAILVRIGLNTGTGIVEKNDIFGDVVNVASRFESLAGPGEIYISENTYNALDDKNEFYCKLLKTTTLKEKRGYFKVYKVFWNEEEIETDKKRGESDELIGTDQPELTQGKISTEFAEDTLLSEERIIFQKSKNFEKNNELIELYLICLEYMHIKPIGDMYQHLRNRLENYKKIETKLNGENAIWFYKNPITIGRLPEADFPITNQAISRIPIQIGLKNEEGIFKIESRDSVDTKSIEIQQQHKTEIVRPDVEYSLGRNGRIIFSFCFPFAYNVYKDRFLTLRILNPEECIKKHFNFTLRDIWKDFDSESRHLIVIGM